MRRISLLVAVLLLLAIPVSAYSGISSARSETTVSANGSCQVTLTLQLTMDTLEGTLVFPVPAEAEEISLNGAAVSSTRSGNVRNVELGGVVTAAGTYTLTLRYRLDNVLSQSEDQTVLTLELLSGFAYPVDSLEFSVTLPDGVDTEPVFTSTYYQNTVDTLMTVTHEGGTVRGRMDQRLQDHEKLILTLEVPAELFTQAAIRRWTPDTVDLVMVGFAVAALVCWLLTMGCGPLRRIRRTTAPDGITAGEIGCRLKGRGVDLTLTVLSWAQMGYLLIQPDGDGRILLHRRMDMGSERSDSERRWFRWLFGKRSIVDGTGYFYARLCRKVAQSRPGFRSHYRKGSGNVPFFRTLAAGVGAVSGVSLATAYAAGSGWRTFLAVVLGCSGFAVAWMLQSAALSFRGRHRSYLAVGVGAALVWLGVSIPAGEWNIALILIPFQLLAGMAALFGGRRTETGRVNAGEILGLRDYLKNMTAEELERNLTIDPMYFYNMAPYTLALGIDRQLARKMGKTRLPECPWLTTGMDGHMTAREWDRLLRDTVGSLDAVQRRMLLERLLRR